MLELCFTSGHIFVTPSDKLDLGRLWEDFTNALHCTTSTRLDEEEDTFREPVTS